MVILDSEQEFRG